MNTTEMRKDLLIAWAYRYISENAALSETEMFPSAALEFFRAAEIVVPDVRTKADIVQYHPDLIEGIARHASA